MLHSGRLRPQSQTLELTKRLASDKILSLLPKFANYGREKFFNIGAGWVFTKILTGYLKSYLHVQFTVGCNLKMHNLFQIIHHPDVKVTEYFCFYNSKIENATECKMTSLKVKVLTKLIRTWTGWLGFHRSDNISLCLIYVAKAQKYITERKELS